MFASRRNFLFLVGILIFALVAVGCIKTNSDATSVKPGKLPGSLGSLPADEEKSEEEVELPDFTTDVNLETLDQVVLKTNRGDISLKLFPEAAPKTVANFVRLAEQDFYDGVKFHRVIKDFMLQAGDPNSKDDNWSDDGQGGPGYKFEDEINPRSLGLTDEQILTLEQIGYAYNYELESHKMVRGKLAMANSGPNTNGSQFFIVTVEATPWLDGRHTVFGEVVEGMDIVDAIEAVATNEQDHPKEDVVIKDIVVVRTEQGDEGGEGEATSTEETEATSTEEETSN
ncbi:peptidylprolyl isomerase [Patescibacteria group bacterium]|nr:peptidylprolyl isomerase [Patescibacteria group bacterium]MBU4512253.1 peptidylprolyl isomerase [Patescibacteria group bacterium]